MPVSGRWLAGWPATKAREEEVIHAEPCPRRFPDQLSAAGLRGITISFPQLLGPLLRPSGAETASTTSAAPNCAAHSSARTGPEQRPHVL